MANVDNDFHMAIDILKEEAPVASIINHYNRAYIHFDFPTDQSNGKDIYLVNIEIIEYNSRDTSFENFISSDIIQFSPSQVMYAKDEPGIPIHHVYKDINNSWYVFKISYIYNPGENIAGDLMHYSHTLRIDVDNFSPQIFSGYISENIRGDLRTILQRNGFITVWFNSYPQHPHVKDLVYHAGAMTTINKIYKNNTIEFQTQPASNSYKEFFLKVINNERFVETIRVYFHSFGFENIPEDGQISFIFKHNLNEYAITISGNLNKLISQQS